ncbi:DUF2254 domain-containing protein [Aridibaculum aurantiacum]|uniref:DUF2254 domain-containing protein n=1 Tax=Aridibaculum aurantiacum TaxID=2810307 RepID=UPI001A9714AD|nr:DUF2254 domain-containing protein [Aridibaculum aurantiacum]
MLDILLKWFRKVYNKSIHSIAFLPAVMAILFLLLAMALIELDEEGSFNNINKYLKWISLSDPTTARTIVATVAAGIISLTVFSFSMVMIVMSQAGSQMSNRMLDNIIGDRVQKIVLAFYTGSIVYSLFLLTQITEQVEVHQLPVLSIYFLLVLTVIDIFLFIYFLHYITQSFRYEQLIQRIHNRSLETLTNNIADSRCSYESFSAEGGRMVLSAESGYFQGFGLGRLLQVAARQDIVIRMLHPMGTHVLKGTPLLVIHGNVEEKNIKNLLVDIDFYYGQEIDKNAYYGFFHLMEVAVKALSPGVNDPGTAVLAIHALSDLFLQIITSPIGNVYKDDEGKVRIVTNTLSFEEIFDKSILPIYDYGKKDRVVMDALKYMISQLMYITEDPSITKFLERKLNDLQPA